MSFGAAVTIERARGEGIAERGLPRHRPARIALLVCIVASTLALSLASLPQAAALPPPQPTDTWVTNGTVRAVARSADRVYLGGDFSIVGPRTGAFASLDGTTGAPDVDFPEVGGGNVVAAAKDGSGGWFLGGSFTHVDGVAIPRLAHVLADGTVDAGFDPAPSASVLALAVSGNSVYVGGNFIAIGGAGRNRIAALNATTGDATAWNPNATNGSVSALAVSGNIVYAGGTFTTSSGGTIGGQPRNRIAALDATTGLATSWNPNATTNAVSTIAVSGSIVFVGGTFTNIGGQPRNRIAALDATTGLATSWNPNATTNAVSTIAVSGSTVYAGGTFSTIGGQSRPRLAALDASTGLATSWNPSVNVSGSAISAIAVDAATVYVGGNFTSVGGQTRNNLAAIDAGTAAPTAWNPNAGSTVQALVLDGGRVYAGGGFRSVGGQMRSNLAALDLSTGAATSWNPDPNGAISALAVDGTTVYAGGAFTSIGGQPRTRIAGLNASNGAATSWAPDADGNVSALAVDGTTVYAGGSFTSIGGQPRSNIAALQASNGSATSWAPNADGVVSALAVDGTKVYAGGDFTSIGGQSRTRIGALDVGNGSATSFTADADGPVTALAVGSGAVYAGGSFSFIGGQVRSRLAALDATTGAATAWTPDADLEVLALQAQGNAVTVGGSFTSMGGRPYRGIALFDASQPSLQVAVTGHGRVTGPGIDCPGDCSEEYAEGTQITLNVDPDLDALFDGWTGDCAGLSTSCDLTMSGFKTISAAFKGPHTLGVTTAGNGTVTGPGINCPADCTQDYSDGTAVALTATPASGSTFEGWSGACTGTGACNVTMGGDQSVTATFATIKHTLTVSVAGSGTGTITGTGINCPGDCTQDVDEGQEVTLSATPEVSSRFDAFSGDCTGTTCTVTMSTDRSVAGTFVARRTLTVATAGSGTVTGTGIDCPGDCTHSYDVGTSVSLSATPGAGSVFGGWSGAGCSGTGSCDVTMDANASVTATFTGRHTLTVTPAGSGTGTITGTGIDCPGDCSEEFDEGTQVTLTAAPGSSSRFGSFSGDCSGSTCVVTMSADKEITGTFVAQHTLTLSTSGSGSVTASGISCPGDCTQDYDEGQQVTLTATPSPGSIFSVWSGACTTAPCTVTMNGDKAVTATFVPALYRPDASIKKSGTSTFIGANKYYSPDGTQTLSLRARKGRTAMFDVALQNDGNVADVLGVKGCGSTTGYSVKYYDGTTAVTTQAISAAGYSTPNLQPQATKTLSLRIYVKSTATTKKSCFIDVRSRTSTSVRDVLKVVVTPY